MIQGSTVRAVMGRDDIVVWPVTAANYVTNPSAITRCVIICKRDGESDVTIDSDVVPDSFIFDDQSAVRGETKHVLKWIPGTAIGEQFTASGRWTCQVFLYDAIHTSGVHHGQFLLEVVFAELPVVGGPVTPLALSRDTYTPTPSASIVMNMNLSDIVPTDEGISDAVVMFSLAAYRASALGAAPTAVNIGGVSASFITQFDTGSLQMVLMAIARIPSDGLTTGTITVTWPGLNTSGTTLFASSRVFYNVNDDTVALLNDHLEEITTDGSPHTAGTLSAPAGGAVFVVNIQDTAFDFHADVDSFVDAASYVRDGFLRNRSSAEVYRLFSVDLEEQLISPVDGNITKEPFVPIVAIVMAGTG